LTKVNFLIQHIVFLSVKWGDWFPGNAGLIPSAAFPHNASEIRLVIQFASKASGFPLERTVKTLVVDLGEKQFTLVLMPGDKQLSMKCLAKVCKVKRASMADTRTAERITGYLVGGISPFGARQKLPVVMEESILKFEEILINAGQRGTMLLMAPTDILKAVVVKVARIAM
jgi:Cys-tRNA(Pro)/Cys-tRNA(Cys) deacylase